MTLRCDCRVQTSLTSQETVAGGQCRRSVHKVPHPPEALFFWFLQPPAEVWCRHLERKELRTSASVVNRFASVTIFENQFIFSKIKGRSCWNALTTSMIASWRGAMSVGRRNYIWLRMSGMRRETRSEALDKMEFKSEMFRRYSADIPVLSKVPRACSSLRTKVNVGIKRIQHPRSSQNRA